MVVAVEYLVRQQLVPARRLLLAGAVWLLSLSGCRGEPGESIPAPSSPNTPTPSPAPSEPHILETAASPCEGMLVEEYDPESEAPSFWCYPPGSVRIRLQPPAGIPETRGETRPRIETVESLQQSVPSLHIGPPSKK